MATPQRERFFRRSSPEERVLLWCAHQELTDARRRDILRTCAEHPLRWKQVFTTSVRHQVAPLLFHNLAQCDDLVTTMPNDVTSRFHHETVRNMAAKRQLHLALVEALGFLEDRAIPCLLIKGTALDRRIWREPWYTVSGDVDLMLRARVDELAPDVRSHLWRLNQARPAVDADCEPHPDLVMNGILPIDFDRVWDRAVSIDVDGRPAYLMSVEHELLSACIQSCRKRFFRLKSLCEIGELSRRHGAELDWDEVAGRARDWRCNTIVYTALRAAALAVDCDLPADLGARLSVPRLRARVLDTLLLRKSFCSLMSLFGGVRVRGKLVGRSLLLHYASHGFRQLLQSARVVGRQMR